MAVFVGIQALLSRCGFEWFVRFFFLTLGEPFAVETKISKNVLARHRNLLTLFRL